MKLEETVKQSKGGDTVPSNEAGPSGIRTPIQTRSRGALAIASPGTATMEAVTDESRCDYIIYTLREKPSNYVTAILIEAKTTSHSAFKHCVAQVMWVVSAAPALGTQKHKNKIVKL